MELPTEMILQIMYWIRDPLEPEHVVQMQQLSSYFRRTRSFMWIYRNVLEQHIRATEMCRRLSHNDNPGLGVPTSCPCGPFSIAADLKIDKHFEKRHAETFEMILRDNPDQVDWLVSLEMRTRDAVPILRGFAHGGAPNLEHLTITRGLRTETQPEPDPSAKMAPLIAFILEHGLWKRMKTLRIDLPNGGFAFEDFSKFGKLLRPKMPRIETLDISFVNQEGESVKCMFSKA